MRGTKGQMDVITRAEFDQSMRDVLTRTDFELRLAETKSEIVSAMKLAMKESIDDLKVDILADVETKVTSAHNLLSMSIVRSSDLKDAKNEIVATMRRNIKEAIDPLKADLDVVKADVTGLKSEMAGLRSDVDTRLLRMGVRLDEMKDQLNSVSDGHKGLDKKLTRLGDEMRERFERNERQLDRQDADLSKLRQSGVLN